jgi:inorganic pyrophosphatase
MPRSSPCTLTIRRCPTSRTSQELPRHTLDELQRFFEDYKKLEHDASVTVERFLGRADAHRMLRRAAKLYDEKVRRAE